MISVLVPWRSNDEHRIRAWHYNRLRWQKLPVQLCVSGDGRASGPFSVSRAVNRARREATGDILAIFGADHVPPGLAKLAWIKQRLAEVPWSGVYAISLLINEGGTARVIDEGMPPAIMASLRSTAVGVCEGILAIRAAVWDDLGGMDERFEGWGAEDTALRTALKALYPDGRLDGEGEAWALYHPDAPRGELTRANVSRYDEYLAAVAAGRMREYLQEVRRDGPGDDRRP
jgi:hypothetical protein